MARLRLFGEAAEAAGTRRDEVPGSSLAEVVAAACERYGPNFAAVARTCTPWVNGASAEPGQSIGPDDEVALLPPVSGG